MDEKIHSWECPWFINASGALAAWNYHTTSELVEIRVADSPIDIAHAALISKVYYESNDVQTTHQAYIDTVHTELSNTSIKNLTYWEKYQYYIHGTCVAGLIVSEPFVFPVDPLRPLPDKYGTKLNVCGIAPNTTIFGLEGTNWLAFDKGLYTSSTHEDSLGNKVFKDRTKTKTIVLNLIT